MKLFYLLLIVVGITSIENKTMAQTNGSSGAITGTVADSTTGSTLEFITVSLLTKNMLVKTGLTQLDGSFTFSDVKPGKYTLSFSSVQYALKTIDAYLPDSVKTNLNLGKIYMNAIVKSLKEVVVSGNKPLIKQEIDRITYNLEVDPDSKGSNLLTMMRKVPFLSVDGDENLLYKGKQDFKVLINGKPSSMFERNLKEVLRSIPASTIQKIEVITNPSSKYDAEGLAGIINIITIKKLEGYRGTINFSERFPLTGPGIGSSFVMKKGKFEFSVLGGSSLIKTPQTKNSNYRISSDTDRTSLLQNSLKETAGYSGYFGLEMSYEINDLNLISTQVNINGSVTETNVKQGNVLSNQNSLLQAYDLDNNNTVNGKGWDAAVNYQLGFKGDKNKLLTFSYRYLAYATMLESQQNIFNRVNYTSPNFTQNNDGRATEQTFQVDYVQQVKKVLVEAGVKGIMRVNNSDFIYNSFNAGSGVYETDHNRSNLFYNNQSIFGAYNSYQFSLKKLEFKAGFCLEQTVIDAHFISDASKVSQNYLSLIPTISIGRKINASNSLNVGFSQRIKRPGLNKLNPFVDRTNPSFESSGNPYLRPSLINTVQLSYSRIKKTTVNVSLDYSFVKKLFLQVSSFDPVSKITRTSFENAGKASGFSANVYLNYPTTKSLTISFNGNGGFNWLQSINGNSLVDIKIFTYNIALFGNYSFCKSWRVNSSINLISKNITSLQGRSNGLVVSSFGINKDIIKNKLTFSASTNNPFTKYRNNKVETVSSNFFQTSLSLDYFRTFSLSMNYNFGALRGAIKKNKRGIKNDDLSN